jgi:UDP-glucose 4-epimerase
MLIAASGTAYGAWPDNPLPLTEEDPLRGKPGFPYVQDKVVQEALADRFAAAHPETRVLRTRATLVLGPHVDNFVSRYFRRPVIFVVRGYNPPAPIVHEEDVAAATWALLRDAPAGAYNLDAPNPITVGEAVTTVGRPVLALPAAVMYPLVRLGWRLRLKVLTEAPPPMLDYLRYPWACDGSRVTEVTDFRYRFDARATLADFVRHL